MTQFKTKTKSFLGHNSFKTTKIQVAKRFFFCLIQLLIGEIGSARVHGQCRCNINTISHRTYIISLLHKANLFFYTDSQGN